MFVQVQVMYHKSGPVKFQTETSFNQQGSFIELLTKPRFCLLHIGLVRTGQVSLDRPVAHKGNSHNCTGRRPGDLEKDRRQPRLFVPHVVQASWHTGFHWKVDLQLGGVFAVFTQTYSSWHDGISISVEVSLTACSSRSLP